MKIKELFEDGADKELADLIKVIKTVCPKNFKALIEGQGIVPALYRGTSQLPHPIAPGLLYFVSPARSTPRESKTGSNVFVSFATSSPLWKDIPRRAYSSSAGTTYDVADAFEGRPYLIIPADNVKSFACMETDFNKFDFSDEDEVTLLDLGDKIETLRGDFLHFYRNAGDVSKDKSFADVVKASRPAFANKNVYLTSQNIRELSDAIESVKKYFKDQPRTAVFSSLMENIKFTSDELDSSLNNMTLIQWLEENMNPDKMGIEVSTSYAGLSRIMLTSQSEVWFEGEYLALRFVSDKMRADDVVRVLRKELKGKI
jgi:hypothetical protein